MGQFDNNTDRVNINNKYFFNNIPMCYCVSACKANCVNFSVGYNFAKKSSNHNSSNKMSSNNKNSSNMGSGLNTSSSTSNKYGTSGSGSSTSGSGSASEGMMNGWSFFSNNNNSSATSTASNTSSAHMKHMNVWMPQTM